MANLRQQLPQALKKCDIVWDGVAVRQHPIGIFKVEVNQARHVVPSAKIQRQNVLAQVIDEFFHLICQRMRLHQRHALDVVGRPATQLSNRLEEIAPP